MASENLHNTPVKNPRPRWLRRTLFGLILLAVYLVSTVPVGLFLYSLKTESGWNVFGRTGLHGYLRCLQQEAKKVELPAWVHQQPAVATGGGTNR